MKTKKHYELLVVGGGISGVCAALAAARHGAKTALIQDRPVLGGNASSEIRMHISGADRQGKRANARETGIIEEILLENQLRNPQHSFSICDTILWEMTQYQENLDLYLNTRFLSTEASDGHIRAVHAHQLTTEKDYRFSADLFIDATGDGMLAAQAGAEVMYGRESKSQFDESLAPDQSDNYTMGNSIMFTARDMGHPVPFHAPTWAYRYDDQDIPGHLYHNHGTVQEATSGYWWLELGGDKLDCIQDCEEIRDELLKTLYGVWDHLKNQDQGCGNLALDWVGFLPGKRESRRIVGDYILRQDDLVQGRLFEDDIAYGGWHLDLHPVGGFAAFDNFREVSEEVAQLKLLKNVYGIPYRCLLPKGMDNLLMAGRAISVSHIAFGSTRVMATCGVIGQAAGTAAAMALKAGLSPRCINVQNLQQTLMKDDCYLPGKHLDPEEKVTVLASSSSPGYEAHHVLDGHLRADQSSSHCWKAQESDVAPMLELRYEKERLIRDIILRFDSNCSAKIAISISDWWKERVLHGIPPELAKDYTLHFLLHGDIVHTENRENNYLRFNRITLSKPVVCDAVRLLIHNTNGCSQAGVFQFETCESIVSP